VFEQTRLVIGSAVGSVATPSPTGVVADADRMPLESG
jgi:hypothetical protein